MPLPKIQSALPKRRYQFGEFVITLLSEIESDDVASYLYIAAVMREGSNQPEVYITCETISSENKSETTPSYRISVLTENDKHLINQGSQWKNEQTFCDYALDGIQQMFQLTDETPILLSQL